VRSVSLVISDRVDKTGRTNSEKPRWTCASGGSGGPRSLRSIEVPTPTPTPPTPLLSSECPSSNFTNLRGQTTQRSVSMQKMKVHINNSIGGFRYVVQKLHSILLRCDEEMDVICHLHSTS